MQHILVAAADAEVGRAVLAELGPHARSARACAGWVDALVAVAARDTRLLLIDSGLPGLSPGLLGELAAAHPHTPLVRVFGGEAPPLERVERGPALRRLAERVLPRGLDPTDRELLGLCGLGANAVATVERLAGAAEPVRLEGERGTGKEWVASLIHQLSGRPGALRTVDPADQVLVRDEAPGTLFAEHVDRFAPGRLRELVELAAATGWKVVGGSRLPRDDRDGIAWTSVQLAPLRERPQDLRPLTRLYVERWRGRLALPRKRVHAGLWQLLERHHWPGNQRELETFVVQAVTSTPGAVLSPGTVPRAVLARLDPVVVEASDTVAFAEVVEERLGPIVARHVSGTEPGLYKMVMEATEAVLFRLAMKRTGGNQKAAAEVLGIARNTLRARWRQEGH